MSEDLAGHVVGLRRELSKLTGQIVDDNFHSMNAVMVHLQKMQDEIDRLAAFVIHRHNEQCMAVLRKKMSQYFSVEETKTLMHDMGISEFDYEGSTISGMHAELIGFCERRELLPALMAALREHRARVQWPDC